ncbi:MAG TPA: hypothetical protein VGK93_00640 [Candidatus Eisenbacteria bacterium]
MNRTLLVALWRQRLTSPLRVVILGFMLLVPLLGTAASRGAGLSLLGDAVGLVLVLGVGAIGQDVSSGVLQLLFARPVRRSEYVVSRWLAIGIGASALTLVQVAMAWGILAGRGAPQTPPEVALFAAGRILETFGVAAVIVLLSSLIAGYGDLAIYVLATLAAGMIGMVGQFQSAPQLVRAGEELHGFLVPRIDLARVLSMTSPPWFEITSWLSTVTLCLALAIVVTNRKEFSYASG